MPDRHALKTGLFSLAGVLLILAVIRYYPLAAMNVSGLLVVVLALSWLAFQYLASIHLMRRHAMLSHVTSENSVLRRLFWDSWLQRLLLALLALTSTLIALTLTSSLNDIEWLAIAASLPVFLLIYFLCNRLFGKELAPRYQQAVLFRISHRCTLALMALVLMIIQFYWLEVPDTRYLPLTMVVQAAYQAQVDAAALAPVGILLGISEAVNSAMWHVLQTASASNQLVSPLKVIAWLVFLLVNALKLGAIWTLLLGVITLVANRRSRDQVSLGSSLFSRAFSVTMIVLLVIYLALTQINIGSYLQPRETETVSTLPLLPPPAEDPCSNVNAAQQQAQQQELLAEARQALSVQQQQLQTRIHQRIDASVERAFVPAYAGVENFLDWNFSLRGQYTQLAFMGRSAVGETSFADYIGEQIDSRVGAVVQPGLAEVNDNIAEEFAAGVQQVYQVQGELMGRLAERVQCFTLPSPTLSLGDYMDKSLVGAGSGAGVLAARASMRMGSRVVSRTATKRVVSGTFARLTGRVASSAAAGSTGALCGPLVFVCAPALAAATWIGTDLLINEADEAMNRDQMYADMLLVLEQDKEAVKAALKQAYDTALAQASADIQEYQDRRFNINRDAFPDASL